MSDFSFTPHQLSRQAAEHFLSVGPKTFIAKYHNHPALPHTLIGKNYMYLTDDLRMVANLIHEEEAKASKDADTLKPKIKPIRLQRHHDDAFEAAANRAQGRR